MSRSNFLDFLSRRWSRLRLSHEVEHSKSRQEERSSELQAMCLTQLHMACMPDCSGHVSCYLMHHASMHVNVLSKLQYAVQ